MSGTTKMSRSRKMASASGVVGPFAPSTISFAFTSRALREVSWKILQQPSDDLVARWKALRWLLRQVPAITELVQLDPAGREQIRVSRVEPAFVRGLAALNESDLGGLAETWHNALSEGDHVEILVPFSDFDGAVVYHCHIVEHEDEMANFCDLRHGTITL